MTRKLATATAAAAAVLIIPAMAAAAPSSWSVIGKDSSAEYSVGTAGPDGSNLILRCQRGGTAEIAVASGGATPYPNSIVGFVVGGGRTEFRVGKQGWVEVGQVARSAPFAGFWRSLRAGRDVSVRFADGRVQRFPLTGTGRVLPLTPCGI